MGAQMGKWYSRLGLYAVIALVWFVIVLRVQPWPFSDYGVFLSVARLLRNGEVLYEGVWDNKDPFVYYSLAIAQGFGQIALWLLELFWFGLSSVAAFIISRHYALTKDWSLYIAGVLTPVMLVSAHYFPGSTHVPGIALTLLFTALILSSRYRWAGSVLGLLLFFKFTMVPIALGAGLVILLRRRNLRAVRQIALTFTALVIITGVVLALRGELVPYLGAIAQNLTYSQTNTSTGSLGLTASVSDRISVLADVNVLVVLAISAMLLLNTRRSVPAREIWMVSAVALVIALLSIVAIGKFPHHAQVLGVSSVLLIVTFSIAHQQLLSKMPFVSALLLAVVALLLAGIPSYTGYRDALINYRGTWNVMTTTDSATKALISSGPPATYAIVQGGGLPRSTGLENWDLICRHIAQRPWESDELLRESLDCFPEAEVLLAGKDFVPIDSPEAYVEFGASVAKLLEESYSCVPAAEVFVCRKLAREAK